MNTEIILNSRRFRQSRDSLCERITRPDFAGYWICQGSPGKPCAPSDSDLTFLWIHGGGYITGHPLTSLSQMPRVAELAEEQSISASVFALQYSLAPEARFPAQIEQGLAAYKYLIEEMRIDPANVVFVGESAGAHLVLSLLYEASIRQLSKPGRTLLVSPWVNLDNSGATFVTNQYRDSLNKVDLDRCRELLLGVHGRNKFHHLVNFSSPLAREHTWDEILPATWIMIGSHDVFLDDVTRFMEAAKADGADVDFCVEEKRGHGWTGFHDLLDTKAYCQLKPYDQTGDLMVMAAFISKGLLCHARISIDSSTGQDG